MSEQTGERHDFNIRRTPLDVGRVLILTSTFPREPGDGTPRFVLDLAKALKTWVDVEVLAPQTQGSLRDDVVEGVAVKRFAYLYPPSAQVLTRGRSLAAVVTESWIAKLQAPFFLIAQTVALLKSVRKFEPTVVNCHWLVPQGLAAALARTFVRFPMVLHVHAADVYFLQRLPFGRQIARFVVRRSVAVLAAGSHVRSALDELLGFESGAQLRPMGVWVERFENPDQSHLETLGLPDESVLFVGRLVEKKGVEYLIRAMVPVRQGRPDIGLVVAGDGPMHDELVDLAQALGLSDAVWFLGTQSHDVVAALMNRADVICVPSIIDSRGETEGMPTVVLEAMASGARVVGSRVDGIPDILRDVDNGWLVEPQDEVSLAEGILSALADPRGALIAQEGANTAQTHDWSAVATEYMRILEQAVLSESGR